MLPHFCTITSYDGLALGVSAGTILDSALYFFCYTEVGCINCPISKLKKHVLHGQVKKKNCFIDTLRYRFQRDVAPSAGVFFFRGVLLVSYDLQLSHFVG